MQLRIEEATIADFPIIKELFYETITTVCTDDYSPEQIQLWSSSIKDEERWKEKIRTQYFIKVLSNDVVVGMGSLENGNYIDVIYVHKDHQRKGIAQFLLNHLIQTAKENNYGSIHSDVSFTAWPFFEKNGFQKSKMNRIIKDGVEINNYKVGRAL